MILHKKVRGKRSPPLKGKNPLRIDPSRTAAIQRRFLADIRRRFQRLREMLIKLIVEEDIFGLEARNVQRESIPPSLRPSNIRNIMDCNVEYNIQIHNIMDCNVEYNIQIHNIMDWAYKPTQEQLKLFREWLDKAMDETIAGEEAQILWERFLEQGYRKGMNRAYDDTKMVRKEMPPPSQPGIPSIARQVFEEKRSGFLKAVFDRPEGVLRQRFNVLLEKSFSEINGIRDEVGDRITGVLAEGILSGDSPYKVADNLDYQLGIGDRMAEGIARTEIIRVHAESQLDMLQELGVTHVGVEVEYSTAGDTDVCEICAVLQGIVIPIDEARGLIPRHRYCRCVWIPANVGEDETGQVRDTADVQEALQKSIEEGGYLA